MTETRPHDVAAIKGILENHYKAWDAGDADAFVTDYAQDATVIMPVASFLKGSTAIDKLESVRFLGENAAVAVSETGVRFPGETEVPAERMVYATWVLEKRDGTWLLAAYHNSPAVLPS